MSIYTFKVINSFDELSALKKKWEDLLDNAIYDSFFCSHGWISCWWQTFAQSDDTMAVVLAEKDGKPVAIAPLMIRSHKEYGFNLRVLRFIGVPNADRCDVIIAKGEQAVIPELVDFLTGQVPGWDQVHLNEVPEESLFGVWLQENKSMVYVEPGSQCPYVPLANWESWDEYYAGLSRNTRKLANRKGNRLQKEGDSRYFYEMNFQEEQLFQEAGELERSSEKACRIEHLVLGDPQQYEFQKKLSAHSSTHSTLLVGLERRDELLAYLYGFIYKDTYYAYNTAYAADQQNHSPGLLVFRETLKHCKEQGVGEFDFLRGAMQIKKHWAKDSRRRQLNLYWLKNKPVNWLYAGAVFTLRPFLKKKVLPLLRKD